MVCQAKKRNRRERGGKRNFLSFSHVQESKRATGRESYSLFLSRSLIIIGFPFLFFIFFFLFFQIFLNIYSIF